MPAGLARNGVLIGDHFGQQCLLIAVRKALDEGSEDCWISYQSYTWPNGGPDHPTPFEYIGPFDAQGRSYPQVQFETAINGSAYLCNTSTGAGCVVPPTDANFYPSRFGECALGACQVSPEQHYGVPSGTPVMREPDIDTEVCAMHSALVKNVRQNQPEHGEHNPDRDRTTQ